MSIKVHPTSEVQTDKIGEGTVIWQYCVILQNAVIGKNCNINFNVFIENDVIIGNDVTIKSGVQLWDGIRIDDNVFIGPNATFVNNPNVRSKVYPEKHIGACIGKGATIGANSTIMGNLTIGEFAFIGAGSVVTCNIPPFTLWYGNPARQQGFVTKDGLPISSILKDKKGNKYKLINDEPILDD